MKKLIALLIGLAAGVLAGPATLPRAFTDQSTLRPGTMIDRFSIVEGVTAFRAEYDGLLTTNLGFELNFLIIEWDKIKPPAKLGLEIHMNEDLTRHYPTRALSENPLAIACINGFYHRVEDPSKTYFPLEIHGKKYDPIQNYLEGVLAFNPWQEPEVTHRKAIEDRIESFDSYAGTDGCPGSSDAPKINYDNPEDLNKRLRSKHAMTAVGHNSETRTTVMVVADGYRPGKATGMSFGEIAWIMSQWEIPHWHVCIFDGGGSSLMAVKNPETKKVHLISKPMDNHITISERRVLTSLQIVYDPGK